MTPMRWSRRTVAGLAAMTLVTLGMASLLTGCSIGAPTENCGVQANGNDLGSGESAFVGFTGSNANQWCSAVDTEYGGFPTKSSSLPGEPQTCQYQVDGSTATLQDTGPGLRKGYSWSNWLDCRELAKWANEGTPP
jgi:hypothetical protein